MGSSDRPLCFRLPIGKIYLFCSLDKLVVRLIWLLDSRVSRRLPLEIKTPRIIKEVTERTAAQSPITRSQYIYISSSVAGPATRRQHTYISGVAFGPAIRRQYIYIACSVAKPASRPRFMPRAMRTPQRRGLRSRRLRGGITAESVGERRLVARPFAQWTPGLASEQPRFW